MLLPLSYTAVVMQTGPIRNKGTIVLTGPLHKKPTWKDI